MRSINILSYQEVLMEIEYANNAMKKTLEDPRLIVKNMGI